MKVADKTALCVIGLGFYSPWIDILESGQELTWLSDVRPSSIQIIHAHGKPLGKFGRYLDKVHEKFRWKSGLSNRLLRVLDFFLTFPFIFHIPSWRIGSELKVVDPVIIINSPDTMLTLRWKELGFFSYFLQNSNADYLVTSTNSSYINLKNLQLLLNQLPGCSVYYGPKPYESAEFISGSFRIFSRDVVELIVKKRIFWEAAVIEDVSLGKLLSKNGIKPVFRVICSYDSEDLIQSASCSDLLSQVHFRLKSGDFENRQDVKLMKALHSRIYYCNHENSVLREQL